jgi:hypothetical protein
LSLLRTSNLPEHDLPEHDLPEHDLEHDRLQHFLPKPEPKPIKTARLHLAVSGAAVALAAAVAGSLGAWSVAGAAQPAAIARPAPIVGMAKPSGTRFTAVPAKPGVLDAFFATASGLSGERPDVGGGVTEGGKGIRLTPRHIARLLLHRFHWRLRQFHYLNLLWSRESGWNIHALNAYSGAYGIPQAVPGSKMAAAGPHWQSSARTQILWGLHYIKQRYGSPEGAWSHELSVGWY